jgi:hypothetical protein
MNRSISRRQALVYAGLLAIYFKTGAIHFADAQDIPLGIKGYDPVAYFTDGKPTPGQPQFEYAWGEYRWRFANAEHLDLFKADPSKYAPQFGNFCAMGSHLARSSSPTLRTG